MKTRVLFSIFFVSAFFCLALMSCNKQKLDDRLLESDVFSIAIEEEFQTKASGTSVLPMDQQKTFFAILYKNGSPVNCSSFRWNLESSCLTEINSGSSTRHNVTCGYITVEGVEKSSGLTLTATPSTSDTGNKEVEGTHIVQVLGVTSVSLSLNDTEVMVGEGSSYTVTATFENGSTSDVTSIATVTSSNSTGFSCTGGVISSSKTNGCLGSRTITASYGGKSSSKSFNVKTDFDYLKFHINTSGSFGECNDTPINSKSYDSFYKLRPLTSANIGEVTFYLDDFYLYVQGQRDPIYGFETTYMDNQRFDYSVTITMTRGVAATLEIYYLGEEVFSTRFNCSFD